METDLVDAIQQIGDLAIDVCDPNYGKILVYSEIQDGVISADVFFISANHSEVQYRFSSDELSDVIYDFWENGNEELKARSWRAMSYLVQNGKFEIQLIYADQSDEGEDQGERRERIVAKHFPGLSIDYSNAE